MSNAEQLNTENIVEEVKEVVTETVPETAPAVETAEKVEEVVNEATEEKKSKSFFDIFKKDKPAEEAVEAPAETADAVEDETVAAEAPAAEAAEGAAAEEVPVDNAPAKKSRLCGLCGLGKKSEEAAPAAEGEDVPAAEGEAAPATEEAAAMAEDAAPAAEESAPIVAAAAVPENEEAAAETTEGEAVAPVAEADVIRSGILFKSGKFFKSNMNERHCRILSSGAFQWSKTEDFTKAHECMITAETTTVAFMAEGESAEHKYRFEMHCCGSVTTYAADTEEDRDEWIRAIETVKESIAPAATEEVAAEAPVEETPAAE